jgi:homocysteine S-methyltransferase
MGTRLRARGLDLRIDDPCLWNLDRPEQVLDVHRRDAAAGSHVLFTNTFGATRVWLTRSGRRGDVEAINRAGVDLARRAAGPSGFVVGDIGASAADEPGAAEEQAAILIDAGVDALILETFLPEAAIAALRVLRPNMGTSAVPLIVSLWRWPDAVEDAARRLVDAGADVIGINCRPPMSGALAVVRRLAEAVSCPLLVKPGVMPGDTQSDSTPAAFAAALPELVEYNVRLIGGCCGTTEAHITALAAACAIHRNPERPDAHELRGAAT